MFRKFLHFPVFFAPPDDMTMGGIPGEEPSDSDVLEEDNDDNSEEESEEEENEEDTSDEDPDKSKDNKENEGEGDDESDEDSDDESDDDESTEGSEDDIEVPPSVEEIKGKYPKFFKEFPEVRAIIYREQQYATLFAGVKEAKLAADKAGVLEQVEADVFGGNPENLLSAVKKGNTDSFEKLALNILPSIQKLDKDMYLKVAALPIKQLLRAAFKEGKTGDKLTDLGKAALWIHNYYFGEDSKITDPLDYEKNLGKEEKSPKEKEYEDRIKALEERDRRAFNNSVDDSYITRISKELRAAVEDDERLSDFVKRTIVRDGLDEIKKQLDADPRFVRQMGALFTQAQKAGYTNDYKSRIVNAALARAKSLVPSIRQKLVSEALGIKTKNKDKGKENSQPKKKTTTTEKPITKGGARSETPKFKSDLDILRG